MNGKGGGGVTVGKGNNGIAAIPAGSRKIVQSLKEIVNCPETEIYAMLKECNMDPNDAVNRLLAQDPFHTVKSKREKKKENKDTSDPRARGASSSIRGGRGGTDRYVGRSGSTQFIFSEYGGAHAKPAYKKENGSHVSTGYSSSTSVGAGNNMQRRTPSSYSDSITMDNKMPALGMGDDISSSAHAASGYQPAWSGVPGVSMADIVKMGRSQNKASGLSNPPQHNVNHHNALPGASYQDLCTSQDQDSRVSEIKSEPGIDTRQHVSPNDDWPLIEHPPAPSVSSVLEAPTDSEPYADPSSNLPLSRTNQCVESQLVESQLDESEETEDDAEETLSANHVGPASVSSRNIQEEDARGASAFDTDLYKNTNSYAFEHNGVEDVSSVSANLEQLNLQKDECSIPFEEDNPTVIIPDHLQVHAPECSHLSFGTFGSRGFTSRPLEETSTTADAPSAAQSDTRTSEYYGDEHLITSMDGSLAHRTTAIAGSYDMPSASEEEASKQETAEGAQADPYNFPSSAPGYTFENTQQLNAAFTHSQTNSQMQNLPPFSSVMQAYTNTLPSTLLASTIQGVRESDIPYSPFPMSQSMSTKYGNATSISSSTIPMQESLRAGSISAQQPTPHNLPGAGVASGPALPQHLVHPYSQPTLPLGHFANMISYPFLPPSYTYMPSAFQQAFAGNSTYHQSLAAVLPQYKNSVSVSSLPQSAAIASGYGFGSSTSIPGNFPLNPPTGAAPAGTTMSYDDVMSSQYKDSNHLISLQQNDSSGMWVQGPGSRTISAVPSSTYYGFQGQTQQPTGFRQGQQPTQHFGALGYPNFYHSQTGISLEHQQQNPREGSLGGSQGQPSKQSQQIWQNSY